MSLQDVIEGILDVDMAVTQSEEFLHYASGGRLLPGSVPLVHRYGGHQVELVSKPVQLDETIQVSVICPQFG